LPAPTESSASLQSVPPHTSGTSPSSSLSSGANTHVALDASHISSRVQGSLSTHSEGDPQMLPTRQPRVGWHTPLSAQSDEVGVCRQLPEALQLSTGAGHAVVAVTHVLTGHVLADHPRCR
jgi:hypothetical protein